MHICVADRARAAISREEHKRTSVEFLGAFVAHGRTLSVIAQRIMTDDSGGCDLPPPKLEAYNERAGSTRVGLLTVGLAASAGLVSSRGALHGDSSDFVRKPALRESVEGAEWPVQVVVVAAGADQFA